MPTSANGPEADIAGAWRSDTDITGGYKIYSLEVENVLSHQPAVLESAIVGTPCPVLGERVHAFVTLKQQASTDELKRYCAERLADYKVPETFTLLDRPLPRNANGKLLKRMLREAASDGSLRH